MTLDGCLCGTNPFTLFTDMTWFLIFNIHLSLKSDFGSEGLCADKVSVSKANLRAAAVCVLCVSLSRWCICIWQYC